MCTCACTSTCVWETGVLLLSLSQRKLWLEIVLISGTLMSRSVGPDHWGDGRGRRTRIQTGKNVQAFQRHAVPSYTRFSEPILLGREASFLEVTSSPVGLAACRNQTQSWLGAWSRGDGGDLRQLRAGCSSDSSVQGCLEGRRCLPGSPRRHSLSSSAGSTLRFLFKQSCSYFFLFQNVFLNLLTYSLFERERGTERQTQFFPLINSLPQCP